jgi:hypothetical protein
MNKNELTQILIEITLLSKEIELKQELVCEEDGLELIKELRDMLKTYVEKINKSIEKKEKENA